MTRLRGLLLLLLAPLVMAQAEPKLVPGVSQRQVEIRYSFTGAELLLFGAILYPGGRVPDDPADIVVVVKGPVEPIIVREKQKVAGIWMNVESERFRSAPSFYAVASSSPLAEMVDDRIAAIYELGVDNLQLSPGAGSTPRKHWLWARMPWRSRGLCLPLLSRASMPSVPTSRSFLTPCGSSFS